MEKQRNLFIFCIILFLSSKLVSGNVVYRFGFDFGFGLARTTFNGTFNITEGRPNDSEELVSNVHPTSAPNVAKMWSQQAELNTAAYENLKSTRDAVTQLRSELIHLMTSSTYLASKIELMTKYLDNVSTELDDTDTAESRFVLLHNFVELVDDLREPPSTQEHGRSLLEYTTLKLALEKHKLIELQTKILLETLEAVETWQKYTETQMIELSTV